MLAVLDDPRLRDRGRGGCSRRWESNAEHVAASGVNGHVQGLQGWLGVLGVEQAVHVDTWGNDVGLLAACQLRSTSGLRLQLRHAHSLGSRAQESAQVDVSTR